jgi:hypothetical protein
MAERANGRAKTEWENLISSSVPKMRATSPGRGPPGGEVMTTEEGMGLDRINKINGIGEGSRPPLHE